MEIMPMFPLGAALLPGERLPLQIFEPRYVAMIQACLAAKSGAPVPTFADPPLVSEPTPRSFALASGLPIGESDRQKVLSAAGPTTRLHVLADALSDVIAVLQFRLL